MNRVFFLEQPETYLCTPIRIESDSDYYVGKWLSNLSNQCKCIISPESELTGFAVGFVPNATMETAHHMLIYGCESPGSEQEVW